MPGDRSKERIEIEVPSKALCIQHAHCPQGCDLMDPNVKIGGYASVRVRARYRDQEGDIFLDPRYGSFENISEVAVPDGEIAEFFCPHCGISLRDEHQRCKVCSAPMFALSLPRGGIIEGCLRKGCFEHVLRIVSGEELLGRLFENDTLSTYL
ncbi:MAG: hypothetical protein ONB23_04435 [candidate division KSB1 bacterium]|nr:hypothetical protein [candidate division KSB1 bacterium]